MYSATFDIHMQYMVGISLWIHTSVGSLNQFSKNIVFVKE